MDIRRIDTSATQGRSWLHQTSASAKLIGFALLLAGVVSSANLLVLAGILLSVAGIAAASRLPMRLALGLAAYPGLFAALYAFGTGASLLTALLVVAKAMTAALVAVVLVLTTPYPQIFAPLQRRLPSVIGDSLLMTYRSLFLLLERFAHVLTAARLRAGVLGRDPVRSAVLVTRSLGGVLLYSIDLSQRTYDVMYLRGYDGRLVVSPARAARRSFALAAVIGSACVAAIAFVWRAGGPALAPFAWLPALGGLAALVFGVLVRLRPEKEAS